jgi:hypothetical protein
MDTTPTPRDYDYDLVAALTLIERGKAETADLRGIADPVAMAHLWLGIAFDSWPAAIRRALAAEAENRAWAQMNKDHDNQQKRLGEMLGQAARDASATRAEVADLRQRFGSWLNTAAVLQGRLDTLEHGINAAVVEVCGKASAWQVIQENDTLGRVRFLATLLQGTQAQHEAAFERAEALQVRAIAAESRAARLASLLRRYAAEVRGAPCLICEATVGHEDGCEVAAELEGRTDGT